MTSQDNNSLTVENVPVFAFPTTLSFIENDKSTYKRILTIYNPYDFTVRFKVRFDLIWKLFPVVLSNCPSNYVLSDSDGLIKVKCGVDILIRYDDTQPWQNLRNNKFRIQIYEHGVDRVIGKRDIKVTAESAATAGKRNTTKDNHNNNSDSIERHHDTTGSNFTNCYSSSQGHGINAIVVLLAAICIGILLLPLPEEKANNVPRFLHVPVTYKLIASFLLGMVTLAVLRN